MISTPVFDDTARSPVEAIARRVAQTHGAVPHLPHWRIIATYDVKPDTRVKVVASKKPPRVAGAQYEVVYIAEYLADRAMRSHLGICDDCLDPMKDSWYLERRIS